MSSFPPLSLRTVTLPNSHMRRLVPSRLQNTGEYNALSEVRRAREVESWTRNVSDSRVESACVESSSIKSRRVRQKVQGAYQVRKSANKLRIVSIYARLRSPLSIAALIVAFRDARLTPSCSS